MDKVFMMTVTGPDSLGLIKALTHETDEFGGVWLRIKMTRLEGLFSALVKVSIDGSNEAALKSSLESKFPHLTFAYSEVCHNTGNATKTVSLELDCKDRPGLIKDINNLLMNLDLKVAHMESHRYAVKGLGGTVFSTKLDLEVDEDTNTEALADELETLTDNARVNIL